MRKPDFPSSPALLPQREKGVVGWAERSEAQQIAGNGGNTKMQVKDDIYRGID